MHLSDEYRFQSSYNEAARAGECQALDIPTRSPCLTRTVRCGIRAGKVWHKPCVATVRRITATTGPCRASNRDSSTTRAA